MWASGGRRGTVYRVTNLDAKGPGSLADAVSRPDRFVVFTVSGTIDLGGKNLSIAQPNITIAGQTAPGEGITLRNGGINVTAGNVIIRHIRVRRGVIQKGNTGDGFGIKGPFENVIVDHVSASWATDENLTLTNANNVTCQYAINAEGLDYYNPPQTPQRHAFGSLFGSAFDDGRMTIHHSLYAHNRLRNARTTAGGRVPPVLEFRNNVVYDSKEATSHTGSQVVHCNWVANYFKDGPSTGIEDHPEEVRQTIFAFHSAGPHRIYLDGNYVFGSPERTADNWKAVAWGRKGKALVKMGEVRADRPVPRAARHHSARAGGLRNRAGRSRRHPAQPRPGGPARGAGRPRRHRRRDQHGSRYSGPRPLADVPLASRSRRFRRRRPAGLLGGPVRCLRPHGRQRRRWLHEYRGVRQQHRSQGRHAAGGVLLRLGFAGLARRRARGRVPRLARRHRGRSESGIHDRRQTRRGGDSQRRALRDRGRPAHRGRQTVVLVLQPSSGAAPRAAAGPRPASAGRPGGRRRPRACPTTTWAARNPRWWRWPKAPAPGPSAFRTSTPRATPRRKTAPGPSASTSSTPWTSARKSNAAPGSPARAKMADPRRVKCLLIARRELLTMMGAAGASYAAGGQQPNILYIMADDHAAHAISAYGSKINKTPNIDRIAGGGMRMTNCFCTNSICTPSRAAILTGQYSHKNGVYTLADQLDPQPQQRRQGTAGRRLPDGDDRQVAPGQRPHRLRLLEHPARPGRLLRPASSSTAARRRSTRATART